MRWFLPVLALVLGVGVYVWMTRPTPKLPTISTAGLDPAVAKLIESTLLELQAAPRSGAAWGGLGSVLIHYEFPGETRQAFEEAERLAPRDARWPYLHGLMLVQKEPHAAIAKFRHAVDLCENKPDMPRLQLAQLLAERGHLEEAEKHLVVLLKLATNHPPALLELARIRMIQGRPQESLKALESCLNDPHTARAAQALEAQVNQTLGNAPAAEAASRRSAGLPPDQPWPDPYWAQALTYRVGLKAVLQDASALMDQGRLAEAIRLLGGAARNYPRDDEVWYLMGWAYNRVQRGADAERALREHLRRMPESPKGLAQLAVSLLSQERYAEAIEILETALKLKPTWRELHFNLGFACVQLGREEEAIGHLRNGLKYDPGHVPSYSALAELLIRRGDRDEALRLLRQALELAPEDQRLHSLLRITGENQ